MDIYEAFVEIYFKATYRGGHLWSPGDCACCPLASVCGGLGLLS